MKQEVTAPHNSYDACFLAIMSCSFACLFLVGALHSSMSNDFVHPLSLTFGHALVADSTAREKITRSIRG